MASSNQRLEFVVDGIPETVPEAAGLVCRSRLLNAATDLAEVVDTADFALVVGTRVAVARLTPAGFREQPADGSGVRYVPSAPRYTFDQLVVPDDVRGELVTAVDFLNVREQVFDDWGLRSIEPFPRSALNFHGPPGTGKTLAAHALAHRLGRNILVASCAEIESKYHGDGPKNVKQLFTAAEESGTVLFVDEADSLLSRRLTNVTQGSEQAINSMRSQLLICLEQFSGVVIFATNLVQNYDKAFETRVRHVRFTLPDSTARTEIWRRHLVAELPTAADVDPTALADKVDDVCGRDIKNAVIDAAVRAAIERRAPLVLADFIEAIERIKNARIETPHPLTETETQEAEQKIRATLQDRDQTLANNMRID